MFLFFEMQSKTHLMNEFWEDTCEYIFVMEELVNDVV